MEVLEEKELKIINVLYDINRNIIKGVFFITVI